MVGKYIYVVVTARKTNYTDTEFRDITDSTNNGNAVVAKKTIVRPTMPSDKTYTYNGMDQTVSINGFDGTTMNVSGNTGTDAGDYTVTVTLKDTNNYQWSDGSTENITLNWKINPKQVVVTWEETTNFGYNGKEQGPSASADSGVSGEILNITTTKGVEIGSYTSTASIASVSGGRGKTSNYVLTNSTKAFTIGKKEIQKTSADYTGNYDGNDHTITLNVTEPTDGYTIYYSTTTSLNASNYTSGSLTKPVIKTGTVIVYWYIHATNENYSDVFGNNKITIIDNVEPTVTINPNGENIELGDSGYYCSVCQTVFQIEHYHCSVHPSEFGTSAKHTCNSIVGICGGSFEFLIEYGNFDSYCPTCMLQGIVNKATVKIKRVCSTAQSIGEPHGSFTGYSCDSHIEEVKQLIIDSHGYDYCEVRKLCDLNLVNTSTRVEAKDSIEVTLKATDEGGSGLDKLQYAWSNSNTIEPTNWENFENNETIIKNNLTEGTYYLWTNVTDKAGNRANNIKVSNPFVITRAIEKKIKPTVKSGTYTYNGKSQEVQISGFDSTTMEINGNTQADVGNYTVVITLKDPTKHQWTDGTTGSVTLNWKIVPKEVSVTWGDVTSFTYNGSPQAPTASADSGISGETLNITRTTEVSAGTHTSTASIASVSGGRGKTSNYVLTNATKEFTINKKAIQKTSGDYIGDYDGNSHTITLVVNEPRNGCNIYYSTSSTLTSSNYSTSGTTSKPSRSSAGTTTVYWYIHSTNGNYSDVSGSNTITINDVEPPETADFVKYDVAYTDVYYPEYKYSTTNGWRLLSYTDNQDGTYSNVKLISTGIPAKVAVDMLGSQLNNDWWVTDALGQQELEEALEWPSDWFSYAGDNSLAVSAGLYSNLGDIEFEYGEIQGKERYNKGSYISITNGSNVYDYYYPFMLKGNSLFKNGNVKLNTVTLTNINKARYNIDLSSTDTIQTSEDETGIYRLDQLKNVEGMSNYVYDSSRYLLATPLISDWDPDAVDYVEANGEIFSGTGVTTIFPEGDGIRPVITINSDRVIFNKSADGKYYTMEY